MDQNLFTFQISPLPEAYIPQLAYALEKRTELLSRIKYPGLWKHTDKLNQTPKRKKSPLRTKLLGILNLALGIFLFVPGVMKPQELFKKSTLVLSPICALVTMSIASLTRSSL